ncbi:MAG: exopolyphosphatase [Parvularculaceae bacterium]
MQNFRAVLDIGSNSVRLVIYDGPPRAPYAICNEKRICGLGRGVEQTGALEPGAVACAVEAMRRFRFLLDEIGAPSVRAVATAAVREAENRDDFLELAREIGFDVETLSGEDEARLAASGVILADPYADGLVGDLGGGSLELVETAFAAGEGKCASARLGALWVVNEAKSAGIAQQSIIDRRLDEISWLADSAAEQFYIVGGAWRHLARVHMILKNHPLSILHNYRTPRSEMIDVCKVIKGLTPESLERLPAIPRRRQEFLPYAATLLQSILDRLPEVKTVVVSAAGVREGALYQALDAEERARDPLLESCRDYAARATPDPEFGEAAAMFTDPLFPEETRRQARLRRAACLLSEIAADCHPDYRDLHAYNTVISGPWTAVTHGERVFLGLVLYYRYGGRREEIDEPEIGALAGDDEHLAAMRLGAALRLAGALAPRAPSVLRRCRMRIENGALLLAIEGGGDIWGENVRKRFAALAELFNLAPRMPEGASGND